MEELKWEENTHGEWHVFNHFWWTLVRKERNGKKFWRLTGGGNKIEAWFEKIEPAKEVARLIQLG